MDPETDGEAADIAYMQNLIDSGMAWRLEGSVGREAIALIEARLCMLGEEPCYDYYGNRVPSRYEIEPGQPGSPID